MSAIASQITGVSTVGSIVCSGAHKKHLRSASPAFVSGILRWTVESPHKEPVTWKIFHLMTSSCIMVRGLWILCLVYPLGLYTKRTFRIIRNKHYRTQALYRSNSHRSLVFLEINHISYYLVIIWLKIIESINDKRIRLLLVRETHRLNLQITLSYAWTLIKFSWHRWRASILYCNLIWTFISRTRFVWATSLSTQFCSWWRNQMETFSVLLVFVRGIHRSPLNSSHKGQWCGYLMFLWSAPE